MSKDVTEEVTDVKKNILEDQKAKEMEQTSLNAEILEYKEIVEILENNKPREWFGNDYLLDLQKRVASKKALK